MTQKHRTPRGHNRTAHPDSVVLTKRVNRNGNKMTESETRRRTKKATRNKKERVNKWFKPSPKVIPLQSLRVSLGTLLAIEDWVKKAQSGQFKNTYSPIMEQIRINGDNLQDVTHAKTLAQIMPYDEMLHRIRTMDSAMCVKDHLVFIEKIAKQYNTNVQNVVDRLAHVRALDAHYKQIDYNPLEEEVDY